MNSLGAHRLNVVALERYAAKNKDIAKKNAFRKPQASDSYVRLVGISLKRLVSRAHDLETKASSSNKIADKMVKTVHMLTASLESVYNKAKKQDNNQYSLHCTYVAIETLFSYLEREDIFNKKEAVLWDAVHIKRKSDCLADALYYDVLTSLDGVHLSLGIQIPDPQKSMVLH